MEHVLGQHIVLWFSRFLNCNFPFKRCLPVHQTAGWSCNLPFSTGRPWNLFGTGRILWCLVWVLTSWRCLAFHSQSTSFPWYPHYMTPHHENNHHPYLFMGGERTKNKTKTTLQHPTELWKKRPYIHPNYIELHGSSLFVHGRMITQKAPSKTWSWPALTSPEAAQLGAFDGTLTDFVTEAMKLSEAQGWRGCGCGWEVAFFSSNFHREKMEEIWHGKVWYKLQIFYTNYNIYVFSIQYIDDTNSRLYISNYRYSVIGRGS